LEKRKQRLIDSIAKINKRNDKSEIDNIQRKERMILQADMDKTKVRLKSMIRQKSIRWLAAGDLNTRFFT